jgi:translocator protein
MFFAEGSHTMARYLPLVLFLVAVVGGGSLIGAGTAPGAWYAALDKPFFDPPDWLFGPVWTVLYILIAIAGWRIWTRQRTGGAMTAWWVQLGLNFLWSPVFFTLQMPGLAVLVVLALLASIVVFMRLAWERDRVSAWLFAPYLAWVAFATLLNVSIWWLN